MRAVRTDLWRFHPVVLGPRLGQSAPEAPLQVSQGPMPADRKKGGKPPDGPPPDDDGNGDGEGDEEEGDGLGANLGQEAFAKMLMKLVKGHTDDKKPRTRESETLRFKETPTPETYREWKKSASDRLDKAWSWIMEVWLDRSLVSLVNS